MKKVFSNRIEYQNKAGQLHREDGPAIEWNNGNKEWWINGLRHRLDGPAVELNNGYKAWYVNGQLHRLDGPAIEWSNGDKSWWINGERFSQQEFEEHSLVIKEKQRKHELEVERIKNNKNKISRWRLL